MHFPGTGRDQLIVPFGCVGGGYLMTEEVNKSLRLGNFLIHIYYQNIE